MLSATLINSADGTGHRSAKRSFRRHGGTNQIGAPRIEIGGSLGRVRHGFGARRPGARQWDDVPDRDRCRPAQRHRRFRPASNGAHSAELRPVFAGLLRRFSDDGIERVAGSPHAELLQRRDVLERSVVAARRRGRGVGDRRDLWTADGSIPFGLAASAAAFTATQSLLYPSGACCSPPGWVGRHC